jgi:hypothetical protein
MNAKRPMSPSDGSVKTLYLVPDRHCGPCTSCCKDLTIDSDELKKPPGVVCTHCVEAKGCGIYETRPTVCRSWFCGWRQMRNLDDSWRPDLCEILVTPAAEGHIPAGYPREGLTFELIGSLDRLTWPPFLQALDVLVENNIPVFLSVRGAPGYVSGNIFLNDKLAGAIAARDRGTMVERLRGALQACVDLPKKKIEFGGPQESVTPN